MSDTSVTADDVVEETEDPQDVISKRVRIVKHVALWGSLIVATVTDTLLATLSSKGVMWMLLIYMPVGVVGFLFVLWKRERMYSEDPLGEGVGHIRYRYDYYVVPWIFLFFIGAIGLIIFFRG